MAGRLLPGVGVRVRRGRRHDLPEVQAILGTPTGRSDVRGFRRIPLDYDRISSGEHPEENLILLAGDTLFAQ